MLLRLKHAPLLAILLVFGLFCRVNPQAAAQTATDGAIDGTIYDTQNHAVPNAIIKIRNEGTNSESNDQADGEGYFRVIHLQPASYLVTISAPGFDGYKSVHTLVHVGVSTTLQPHLLVGTSSETVTVSGEAPSVNTTSPDFANVIGQTTLNDLPVNNYRWSSYALLTPGVVADSSGYGLLSFRGQSTLLNNVTIDGADDNQAFFSEERGRTRAGYSTAKAAIQEFQVNTSNYSVEYGRSAGGVVNAVTKSGTNSLHGQGYFFDRNADWGTVNPFTTHAIPTAPGATTFTSVPFKPKDVRYQYGGGVGGPIIADKLFFFLAIDRYYRDFPGISAPSSPNVFYATPDPVLPNADSCTASASNYVGNDKKITSTENTVDTNVCIITQNLKNTYAQALALYTKGIADLTAITGTNARTGDQTIFFPKLDWQINARNHASVEYNRLRWTSPAGIQTGSSAVSYGVESFGNDYVRDNWLVAKLDTLITPTVSNQLRYQYGRDFEFEYGQKPTAYENATLTGPTAGGYSNPFGATPPNVNISGAIQFGLATFLQRPAYPDERRYQVSDTANWVRGKHNLKFGVDLLHTNDLSENLTSQYGGFSYSNLGTYFSDYYLAQNPATAGTAKHYSSYGQGFGPLGFEFQTWDYAAFVQDEWKATPRLSLTLGLRYEFEKFPNPQLPNTAISQTTAFPSNKTNLGPRVGFAYDLLGKGKTVIRGGYGEFFARALNSTMYNAIAQTGSPKGQLQFSYGTTDIGAPAFPQVIPNASAAGTPPNVIYFDKNFKVPEIHQTDLTFQQDVGWNTVVSATYLGAMGRRMPDFVDTNLPTPTTINYRVVDTTGKGPLANGSVLTTNFYAKAVKPAGAPSSYNSRPDLNFGALTDIFSGVNSSYNALVIQVDHRMTHYVQFSANYTWSHALDYGENNTTFSNTNALLDPTNLGLDYGNSNQNVPHRVVTNAIFDSPWHATGWRSFLLNNYELAPSFQAQSGLPYSVGTTGTSSLAAAPGVAATGFGGLNGSNGAYRLPGLDRNLYQQPRTMLLDARLSKRFIVKERYAVELLAESFNLANHQNITGVNGTAYASALVSTSNTVNGKSVSTPQYNTLTYQPTYGTASSANSNFIYTPRQVQFGARFDF